MSTSSHPILLAALDLDGTLLNSSGEVTDYTRKVLSEASDRGVVIIPATGRPLASLPPEDQEALFRGIVIKNEEDLRYRLEDFLS